MLPLYLACVSLLWTYCSPSVSATDLAKDDNYLGCYVEIQNGGRLLNGFQQNFPDNLTPDACVSLCSQKGFYYAGTQYRTECFCAKTKPVEDQKARTDGECDLKCSGDESKYCGGNNRLSIYRTGIKEDVATAKYLGCYAERIDGVRLLKEFQQNFPDTLTPNMCIDLCIEKGFSYAGTQFRYECYCSRSQPNDEKKVEEWQCNSNCSGDNTKHCGGTNRLSIYRTGVKEDFSGLATADNFVGCYVETPNNRLLNGYLQTFPDSLTPGLCVSVCLHKGFAYAGAQYRVECFCSKTKPPDGQKAGSNGECDMRCSGDNSKYCGGVNRISVYKTGAQEIVASLASASSYLGCYMEIPGRLLNGLQENFPETLTPELCVAFCLQKGFAYAGSQYRIECFCSNTKPADSQKAGSDGQCNVKCSGDESKICGGNNRISVYRTNMIEATSVSSTSSNYLGCYVEITNGRLLGELQENFEDTLTPEVCIAFCIQKGFDYAGAQYRIECFCSNKKPQESQKVGDDAQCDMKCSGDKLKTCGGVNRISVYRTKTNEVIPSLSGANSYLGCYMEIPGRLLSGLQKNFAETLTPEVCMAFCLQKGFDYAGSQYRIECFCSNTKPADNQKAGSDGQCNIKCSGDESKICGGNNRLSVYRTNNIEDTRGAASVNYIGCYAERSDGGRLLNGLQTNFPGSLTPDLCHALCFEKGFAFAGTQYRVECFCSKRKPHDERKLADHECNMKCAGDPSVNCGGNYRISVYKTGIKEEVPSVPISMPPNYLGCYVDNINGRLLDGFQQNFPDTLTPDVCITLCLQKGFAIAGTQYRVECFCAKTKPADNRKAIGDEECDSTCSGDNSKNCGGINRLSVYKTGIKEDVADAVDHIKYMGCFKDFSNGTRLMSGYRQDFPYLLTNEICTTVCKKKGFAYAGMQYGKECFCDNKNPSFMNYASDEECSMRCDGNNLQLCGGYFRLSVFFTGIPGASADFEVGKYVGCYRDRRSPRYLGGFTKNFRNGLTLLKCTGLCYSKGFLYAGTQNSKECYCGDEHPSPSFKAPENDCSKPCTGDTSTICGGDLRNSIRETGITDYPAEERFLGCFDDTDHQIFNNGLNVTIDLTNSPRRCFNICWQLGFKYSGVEFGKECHCGNQMPAPYLAVSGDECNMACAGDLLESCGGSWRMALYSIANYVAVPHVTDKISTGTTSTPVTDPSCIQSPTTFNGKAACHGDVIFEDQFKTPLGNKWKNLVVIPESPDNEFVLLHADPKNCYISRNNLVIKPTILNDSFVKTGSLMLQGCTGARGTRECGYQAFSYNILPPVASARINTQHSFTFRYGIVEIRAKLPLGDWLVPEIWLEPKHHQPGAEYFQSGRIRLAMCRGNEQLQCGEEALGRSSLESGVMMGPENDVRSRMVHSTVPNTWHDFFHTYTLIWKPESISFKIDNDPPQELVPQGVRLCEAIGFSSQQCDLWGPNSNIAPFNREFYISLGLSAGNSRDFPDNCLNRGKIKPWRNWEVKAMLKFWQNKNEWQTTWSEDKSSLLVEYVRVTAL